MRVFLALLVMSNLILPKKAGLWLPDHQLVTPAQAIVPPRPQFMGGAIPAARAGKARGKSVVGGNFGTIRLAAQWPVAGDGNSEVSSGGRFNDGNVANGSVVTSESAGRAFPTVNCLDVPNGEGLFECRPRVTGLGQPAVGITRRYRIYGSWEHGPISEGTGPGFNDEQSHPFQDANAGGGINWEWSFLTGPTHGENTNQYRVGLQFASSNSFPTQRWTLPANSLNKQQVLRFEVSITRLADVGGSARFRAHPWIFDTSNNELFGPEDFLNENSSANLSSNPTLIQGSEGWAAMDGFNCGTNQSNYMPIGATSRRYMYQGALLIADTDQGPSPLGPYNHAIESAWTP